MGMWESDGHMGTLWAHWTSMGPWESHRTMERGVNVMRAARYYRLDRGRDDFVILVLVRNLSWWTQIKRPYTSPQHISACRDAALCMSRRGPQIVAQ